MPENESNPFDGLINPENPPKFIKFFGFAYDKYTPSKKDRSKNYITKCDIFLIDGHGYYAQAIVSTCRMRGGMVDIDSKVYPIKIDIEKKQFLMITSEKGLCTFEECLKVENIEKMIDLVIAAVMNEPQAEIKFVSAEEPDTADFWKTKNEDPDWWKKGGKPFGDAG